MRTRLRAICRKLVEDAEALERLCRDLDPARPDDLGRALLALGRLGKGVCDAGDVLEPGWDRPDTIPLNRGEPTDAQLAEMAFAGAVADFVVPEDDDAPAPRGGPVWADLRILDDEPDGSGTGCPADGPAPGEARA